MAVPSLVQLLALGLGVGAAATLAAVSVSDTRSVLLREGRDVPIPLGGWHRVGDDVSSNERNFADPALLFGKEAAIQRAAARALAHDPLDAMALRQFAISAALNRPGQGQAALRLAEQISRRDLLTQMALVEVDVASGDVRGILLHYDRAMTVHPEVKPLLVPVLASAINEADVRAALVGFAHRPWFPEIFESGLGQGADAGSLASLLRQVRPVLDGAIADRLQASLVRQLVSRGDYASVRPLLAGDRNMSALISDLGFSIVTTNVRYSPLNWQFNIDAVVQAQFDGFHAAQVEVAAERSGVVAERTTLLWPGNYRLSVQLDAPTSGPPAQVTWQVICLGGASGKKVMEWSPAPRAGSVSWDVAFAVPGDCPAQQWRIMAVAAASQMPSRISLAQKLVD